MFTKQQRVKGFAFLFWILVIGGYWWITELYDLSPAAKIQLLADIFLQEPFGPLLFIIIFALQPLVFFPSFLLGIAGGILYGPLWGTVYVFLGGETSLQFQRTQIKRVAHIDTEHFNSCTMPDFSRYIGCTRFPGETFSLVAQRG